MAAADVAVVDVSSTTYDVDDVDVVVVRDDVDVIDVDDRKRVESLSWGVRRRGRCETDENDDVDATRRASA